MPDISLEELQSFSVRELRRQAAVRNVPLQQIGAAVEKKELINLIINARPIGDQYQVGSLTRVHSAESIAYEAKSGRLPNRKRKKSRSRSSSSTSDKRKKKRKGRSRSRRRRRSPDASRKAMPQIREAARALLTAQAPEMISIPAGSSHRGVLTAGGAHTVVVEDEPKSTEPSVAEAGMAAAAALGFNVLPKGPKRALPAPALGLRPSINAPPGVPSFSIGNASLASLAGRICVEYLCKASCALGANCPEVHITDPEEEMKVRARFKEQECHYGANCTRSSCLYRHPGEKLDNFAGLSLVPEGQQVQMKVTGSGLALDFK